jgi:hypothetical protein
MKVLLFTVLLFPFFYFAQQFNIHVGVNSTPRNNYLNAGYNLGFQYAHNIKGPWDISIGLSNDVIKHAYTSSYSFTAPSFPSQEYERRYNLQNMATIPIGLHLNMALNRNEGLDLYLAIYANNGLRIHEKNVVKIEENKIVNRTMVINDRLLYQGGFSFGFEGDYLLNNKKTIGFGICYRLNHLKMFENQQGISLNNFQSFIRFGLNCMRKNKLN